MTRVLPTQAAIARAIKATIRGYQDATGRIATATRVTFRAGEPIVEVTSSVESPPAPPSPDEGGVNVQSLQAEIRKRHAARRT